MYGADQFIKEPSMLAKLSNIAIAAVVLTASAHGASIVTLCDFESDESSKILERHGQIQYVPDHATQKKNAGKIPGGFTLGMGDWTGCPSDISPYDTMAIDVYNPGQPGKLELRIVDGQGNEWGKRHNSSYDVKTGQGTIIMKVGKVYRGQQDDGVYLDKRAIKQIYIVMPTSSPEFYVDNWRIGKQ
jgi:hypothetical protein